MMPPSPSMYRLTTLMLNFLFRSVSGKSSLEAISSSRVSKDVQCNGCQTHCTHSKNMSKSTKYLIRLEWDYFIWDR
jgi:hypothetical protein